MSTASPRRRADAQRNYDLLLATAKEVFGEHGADAPLDEVARRAGIGNATMYRHFPTRRDLLVAVYADEVTALCARGEALLVADSPGDALFQWLRSFIAHVVTKQDLARSLMAGPAGLHSERFGQWHDAMLSTAGSLLVRAQEAGDVRADLPVRDVLWLANGIALTGADDERAVRLLRLVRDGAANR
ncbi:TetR/AcrR family transcriptional regulator [Fodinicola feengrottensis]|uniref:TetR/AcrR family transcriptional regulator n=1 Tax=Fodinicola feengrottensis TaxID=435914 RepID=A0ABN2HVJ7_9ACTN